MSQIPRAATGTELTRFRTAGQWSKVFAVALPPLVVYRARINQTFSTTDGVLEITYDGASGTLADVRADMTVLVGSTLDGYDKGICRLRSIDATKFYISQTSDIAFANDQYLTVLYDWSLWAKHVTISGSTAFMDGGIAYSNQHTNFDPVPIMGSHRVLKKTGATVSTTFDFSLSYVPDGSSITGYSTSAPTASASSGMTTSTPTVTFNTLGWHVIYLTLTAGTKSFIGVRWVYVYDQDHLPSDAVIEDNGVDEDAGGWQFTITMFDNATPASIRDRTLVIVFAEDHYGTTAESIGPITGAENVVLTGWIAGKSINWNPEQGAVQFTCYTAQHWLNMIPAYPTGVEWTQKTPAVWTQMKNLTVRLGLFHFLHWRTTATRVMDVFLPTDTRLTLECNAMSTNLWQQIGEIAWEQIRARAGVDRYNRLHIGIHPQLTPTASRTWATVMTITKEDWQGDIDFEQSITEQIAISELAGVVINSSGHDTPYFSVAPGHTFPHYGGLDSIPNLLIESQSQLNILNGLYRSWQNNPFKDIPIKFASNMRLLDVFPNQKCAITIATGDTPAGISYSGGLLPTSLRFVHSPETGSLHLEASFEGETFEGMAVTTTVPGDGDVSIPPTPPLPPLPPIDTVIIPGTIELGGGFGPPRVLLADGNAGLLYSENFDEEDGANVKWKTVNSGLTANQYQAINEIVLTPSGGVYVAHRRRNFGDAFDPFIAYAPSIGATFTVLEDAASIVAKLSTATPDTYGVNAVGVNPLTGQAAYVIAVVESAYLYVGSGASFAQAVSLTTTRNNAGAVGNLSFGFNNWRLTTSGDDTVPRFIAISADGSTIIRTVSYSSGSQQHIPVGTSDAVITMRSGAFRRITQNGAVAGDFTTAIGSLVQSDNHWDNKVACDPTGMDIFLPWDAIGQRGRSSDGGATISGIPTLPFGGVYAYDYAGGVGAESRWVAARGIIRYSPDRGDTWHNKEGDALQLVTPAIGVNIVKVVSYS